MSDTPAPPPLDVAMIHQVLSRFKDFDKAEAALERAGYTGPEPGWLRALVSLDPVLSGWWGDGSVVVADLTPTEIDTINRGASGSTDDLPPGEARILAAKAHQAHDDLIMAKGLSAVGFNPDEIQELVAFSEIVGHGFQRLHDFTNGALSAQLFRLQKRIQFIDEQILQCDERCERWVVTEKGQVVRFNAEKYTEEEKLEWQKEQRQLIDQMRRIADSANASMALRIKAKNLADRHDPPHGSKASKRKLKGT